jgi:plasmid stabilization system protein ParE
MTRSVRVLGKATADLVEIKRYLDRDSPKAAGRVIDGLLAAIESLGDLPESGPVPRDERLKRLGYRVLKRDRHLVFYRIVGKQVRVCRVLHQRRAWERLL